LVAQPLTAAEAIAAAKTTPRTKVNETQEVNDRGFVKVYDKMTLVGKPFLVIDWEENLGESYWYADVHIVMNNRALYFTDGSTGVYEQLKKLRDDKGVTTMIDCPKGLRVSKYRNPVDPERISSTYYLDDNAL
jgi:hypothetical protein